MTAEYEKLLLSPRRQDEIINMLGKPTKACADCSTGLCQAQLDKILKGEWLDKPDSQGDWWHSKDMSRTYFVGMWSAENWNLVGIKYMTGKCQREIVPNPQKE